MVKTTMYFGRKITWRDSNGKAIDDEVTHSNWIGFIEQVVDKFFEGYTWWDANGVWLGEKEDSFVLEIIHEKTLSNAGAVVEIAEEYKKLYNQDAVAVTTREINFRLI